MLNSLQIITSVENPSAGPSYSVPRLAAALGAHGSDSAVLSLGEPRETVRDGWRDIRVARDTMLGPLKQLEPSRALRRALLNSEADVFHVHGLWRWPNVTPSLVARRCCIPLILSPRGTLGVEALAFSSWQKRLFWALAQSRAVRQAVCLHATAESEYEEIRAFGLRQPVAMIPNGVDIPPLADRAESDVSESQYALSLCRLHPKKGLDVLISAWAQIEATLPGWHLRIVGPDEGGYATELHALVERLNLTSVTIEPPVFGEEKTALMQQAALFVLPSLNENFAMTVAESLAAGVPVIASKGAPWAGLETHGCGWWVAPDCEAFATGLLQALSVSSEERRVMGLRGRVWMESAFSWERVAEEMVEVYDWAIRGGTPPTSVRED